MFIFVSNLFILINLTFIYVFSFNLVLLCISCVMKIRSRKDNAFAVTVLTLHNVLYKFPLVLTRKICLQSKAPLHGDRIFYSYDLSIWFGIETACKEKKAASRSSHKPQDEEHCVITLPVLHSI